MSRRAALIGGAVLAAVLLVALVAPMLRSNQNDEPTFAYCLAFGKGVVDTVEQVDRAIDGDPAPGDLSMETLKGASTFVWGDSVATSGDPSLDDEAMLVGAAIRRRLDGRGQPLMDTPEVVAAAKKLDAEGKDLCAEHNDLKGSR